MAQHDDRSSGRGFGKASLTRDHEMNFDNIEMIEKSEHERVCVIEERFIEQCRQAFIILNRISAATSLYRSFQNEWSIITINE
uniref:Uncharacterized protein n=1 Tax=Romanomermis culicivorax TaxID=13658 RepID=A0A915IA18_ROMCU